MAGIGSLCTHPPVRVSDDMLPYMPHVEDFTLLCWKNGPLNYLGMTTPPTDAILCLQSGAIGVEIDTQALKFPHAGRFANSSGIEAALTNGIDAIEALPAMPLELSVEADGKKYTCSGRAPLSKDAARFPVRFVDSGHFFQRLAIEDLEFVDPAGEHFKAKGRIEFAFWPKHLSFTVTVLPTDGASLTGVLLVTAGGTRGETALKTNASLTLTPIELTCAPHPALHVSTPNTPANWDGDLDCHVVHLPAHEWKNTLLTYYPSDELDRIDATNLNLSNDSDCETTASLMFVPDRVTSVTGVTAILCDPDGTPTGIPVQMSKNWHASATIKDLNYQGGWFHGFTYIHLPPHSHREFTLRMVYARYGGVPAASHAQLCLIGWSHNQFWDEAAIGSFGETICFEPGRLQRRCFIDDLRPLFTLKGAGEKPYGWPGNCGGGDYLMWLDQAGVYRGFRRTRTNYRASGPCLTDVEYVEETNGGEIAARMKVSIERSDDYVRVLQHIRYDVRKKVRWQRLAFFQLGADFYNETPTRAIAAGDIHGMREEWDVKSRPERKIPLDGPTPWISLHGSPRADIPAGAAAVSRMFVVRSWGAVLGQRQSPTPYVSVVPTPWADTRIKTTVELCPPPDLTELLPGDYVDAEVEIGVFPAEAAMYYGPNEPFRQALKQSANQWQLAQREAAGNTLSVNAHSGCVKHLYPLEIAAHNHTSADVTVSGGIGYMPVAFHDLETHRDYELRVNGAPLTQAIHGNDFWQTDYDPATRKWSLTYNIMRDGTGDARLEFHSLKKTADRR